MNILVVSNLFPPHAVGGYEVACETFARRFPRDRVTVLTTHYGLPGPTVEGDVIRVLPNVFGRWPEGETELPRGWRRFFTPEVFGTATQWIRKIRPDVCYVWNLAGLSLAPAVAARLASVPVAFHFEDNWLPDVAFHPRKPLEQVKRLLGAPFTFPGKTGAIFVSDFLRRSYCSQGFTFAENTVIHNGVEGASVPEFANEYPPSGTRPMRLLFVGRIVPEKGVEILLEAMRIAQHGAPGSLALSIGGFGPVPYVQKLQQLASRDGADVRWLGRLGRDALENVYRDHDVAVVPSVWEEPFGLVAVEAMAAGLPVVATRSGGLPEIVRHGFNGCLVPPNDASALYHSLMAFVDDPGLRRTLAQQAARDVRDRFDAHRRAYEARTFLDRVVNS
jgi:glycogen(starch) synthase